MCSKIINWRICNTLFTSDVSQSKKSLDLVSLLIKHISWRFYCSEMSFQKMINWKDVWFRYQISSHHCIVSHTGRKQMKKKKTGKKQHEHIHFFSLNPSFILSERQKRVFTFKRLPIRLSSPSVLWLNLATLSMTTNKRWWLEFVNKQKLKEEKNSKQQQIAR